MMQQFCLHPWATPEETAAKLGSDTQKVIGRTLMDEIA